MNMNIETYLARVGQSERPRANLEGLRALHRAHLRAIPFENLDQQLGRPVSLEIPTIYKKIVEQRRGGWCYEMNGLFGWALGELGFDVTRLAGGVMREVHGDEAVGNHLCLKITLPEGIYFADVGLGDGPHEPFKIEEGDFAANGFPFALSRQSEGRWRMHNLREGACFLSYDVLKDRADEALLAQRCVWLQTSSESPFVQNLICLRHHECGLTILRGRVLQHIAPGSKRERILRHADELIEVLIREFGLDFPEAATLWPKMCERHQALFDTK